jgi:hypothetical protein
MIRLAVFIIALLLAVGAIDATDDAWLITLAVLAGVAAFTGGGLRPRFRRVRRWVDGDWDW